MAGTRAKRWFRHALGLAVISPHVLAHGSVLPKSVRCFKMHYILYLFKLIDSYATLMHVYTPPVLKSTNSGTSYSVLRPTYINHHPYRVPSAILHFVNKKTYG